MSSRGADGCTLDISPLTRASDCAHRGLVPNGTFYGPSPSPPTRLAPPHHSLYPLVISLSPFPTLPSLRAQPILPALVHLDFSPPLGFHPAHPLCLGSSGPLPPIPSSCPLVLCFINALVCRGVAECGRHICYAKTNYCLSLVGPHPLATVYLRPRSNYCRHIHISFVKGPREAYDAPIARQRDMDVTLPTVAFCRITSGRAWSTQFFDASCGSD
ncbi:hypothetical protein PoB_001439300 [Plakobranchus ocellatus]|uniref:Uncharacterized protein n=1 Tax=Plakobranchus ocellatus TaxID=259542 RepID=A0AAV3YZF6_9GAST|nr:hypothetical protein PoB_001439300 [Plakobranchus ocellatus]